MIGRTLATYLTARFLKANLAIFAAIFAIVLLVDFLELFRRVSGRAEIGVGSLIYISLLRVPAICEQILPFAVLFGTMAVLLSLARNLELVVLRAAGVAARQFLLPALGVAVFLGIVGTFVYNPLAATLNAQADTAIQLVTGRDGRLAEGNRVTWFRQDGRDGESVVRAATSADGGAALGGVTAWRYDRTGVFVERLDADRARFLPGRWVLESGASVAANGRSETFQTRDLATSMSLEQIRDRLSPPDTVPFWHLPHMIEAAQNAGLPAYAYALQFHLLLARPLLLAAMALVASLVSLRAFRFGNIGRMIVYGIAAGFVLYVLVEIARDVGSAGLILPAVAAWLPGVAAALIGLTIFLYQEEG